MTVTVNSLSDDLIVALFEKHCECRPTDVARISHGRDCNTLYTNACRKALAAPYGSRDWLFAREQLMEILNEDPEGSTLMKRLKCECELRNRQWNGYGRCLFCGCSYDGETTFRQARSDPTTTALQKATAERDQFRAETDRMSLALVAAYTAIEGLTSERDYLRAEVARLTDGKVRSEKPA